jgi:predicted DsbA family dithiol-disulfide isomerase
MTEPVSALGHEAVQIDIVSDVMCPWCYIGMKRLDKAVERSRVDVAVHWRPYQLDPTLPPEGKDRKQYLEHKFGGPERAQAIYDRVREAGRDDGIAFDFNAIRVSPNTLDAHRVLRWAANAGEGVQSKLAERLFRLYFEEGANIGNRDVLADAAAECGMERAIVADLLASGLDRDKVEAEIAVAQRMGVTGVPCFIIEGRYAIMGAQEPETLADALKQVAEMKAKGQMRTQMPQG